MKSILHEGVWYRQVVSESNDYKWKAFYTKVSGIDR